jgi:hypothetical protein
MSGGGALSCIGDVFHGGRCVVLFGNDCWTAAGVGAVFDSGVSKIAAS